MSESRNISTGGPALSFDEFDEINDPRPERTDFDAVVERALSRRQLIGRGAGLGAVAFLLGSTALLPARARAAAHANSRLTFAQVAANDHDTVTVPAGYKWQVVAAWGEPMWSTSKDFDPATTGTGESQELAFGDNCDGMELFVAPGGRSVLAVNNEYTNQAVIYHARASKKPENADDVRKGKAAHGVSVIEIAEAGGGWQIVKDSTYNRRITADTPMQLTGPAAGHDWLKTAADPSGTRSLGTMNNCGAGRTPWNTFLTCEENFNGYFSASDENFKPTAEMNRYGVRNKDWGYAWATADERFDIAKHPNEPNRVGYIVEIDPLDPASTPKKRTALGRFKHENAALAVAANGQVVVYMGDDERGEFMYKFVSDGRYTPGGNTDELLDKGRLYVARFSDDMTGQWVELTPASTGMASQAEICVLTRIAASKVGATTMDRPEWVAVNPKKAEVYCTLTNNKNRGVKPNAGGDETPVGGPNPREKNNYGQIVRWWPDGGDHTAPGFKWDLYVTAGNPTVHQDAYAGSKNVTPENMFNSPDGLGFDSAGLLWIQTDGNYSNAKDFAGQGNNQMLIGDPETGEIKRFLVGPKECEVTGIAWSADRKTLFVGIQHPGEKGHGNWPGGGSSLPRSAVIAIQRDDGGLIG
jgi:secreted PhoX family phosphatase